MEALSKNNGKKGLADADRWGYTEDHFQKLLGAEENEAYDQEELSLTEKATFHKYSSSAKKAGGGRKSRKQVARHRPSSKRGAAAEDHGDECIALPDPLPAHFGPGLLRAARGVQAGFTMRAELVSYVTILPPDVHGCPSVEAVLLAAQKSGPFECAACSSKKRKADSGCSHEKDGTLSKWVVVAAADGLLCTAGSLGMFWVYLNLSAEGAQTVNHLAFLSHTLKRWPDANKQKGLGDTEAVDASLTLLLSLLLCARAWAVSTPDTPDTYAACLFAKLCGHTEAVRVALRARGAGKVAYRMMVGATKLAEAYFANAPALHPHAKALLGELCRWRNRPDKADLLVQMASGLHPKACAEAPVDPPLTGSEQAQLAQDMGRGASKSRNRY